MSRFLPIFFPSKTAIFSKSNTPISCQSAFNYPGGYVVSSADRGISLLGCCIAISPLQRTSPVTFRQTFLFESKTIRPPAPCTDVATSSPETRDHWSIAINRDTLLAVRYSQNLATKACQLPTTITHSILIRF